MVARIFHREAPMSRCRLRNLLREPAMSQSAPPARPSRRPLHAGEAHDRGRDPEGGLPHPEGEPRRGGRQEDHCRVGAALGHRAGARLRRRGAGRHVAESVPGRDAAVDQGRGARDRGQGAGRRDLHLQRRALPLRRDLQGDGAGRDRAPAVVQPRRRVLRGLRPQAQARAHADHHAGRQPLRLQVHVRKDDLARWDAQSTLSGR